VNLCLRGDHRLVQGKEEVSFEHQTTVWGNFASLGTHGVPWQVEGRVGP
jgi:hypothetical protein